MLAICLGRFHGYEHFYTTSGKWFSGLGIRTLFVVRNFATYEEIEPIIAHLPSGEISIEEINALQDLGHGPTRTTGAKLLRKMLEFTHASEAIYQANAGTLDASSAFIGDPVKHKYLTLHEIADLLLPPHLKKDGKFDSFALYAVHRSLMQDEVFFRPLKETGHRGSYLFEISPLSEVRIVQKVESLTREYLASLKGIEGSPSSKGRSNPLFGFAHRARRAIDRSRNYRQWTESGIIGPSRSEQPQTGEEWTPVDHEILRFIELWAAYQKFPAYSRFQCIGPAILKIIDRYHEAENLAQTTGWTFLQEVRWIPPWEIPARYQVRLPDVDIKRGAGYIRPSFGMLDRYIKDDVFSDNRKVWEGVTAYCIDSEHTMDIDDAISLEKTPVPGQYWIHVHVADPASCIPAETPVAKYAELIPETVYLAGHFERMLPADISQDNFSLAPDRPCLTFSALVNEEGNVLKHEVVPGRLKEVVYMTGQGVASAIGETRPDPVIGGDELQIGEMPERKPAPRKVTQPADLTEEQKAELSKLSELGKAVQAIRLKKGATPFFQPRVEAWAEFDQVSQQTDGDDIILSAGDPSIRIGYSKPTETELVEHAMRLAGEVAAKWCHERNIPIPYRTQPQAAQNAALIQEYTRDVFYPVLKAGLRPEDHQWRHLRALLGGDEISSTAGPHFTLGADMYTKATSPLRRFGDLIVHWQIEAAILEERRTGQSLVDRKLEDNEMGFLPFEREHLDRMLPMLRLRERQVRSLMRREGMEQWILQGLVRAWRFGEASIPETFRFRVLHISGRSNLVGQLDFLERPAFLRPSALNDVTRMVDVRIGDVFRVRLRSINVHGQQIQVEALELLERAPEKATVVTAAIEGKELPGGAQQVAAS